MRVREEEARHRRWKGAHEEYSSAVEGEVHSAAHASPVGRVGMKRSYLPSLNA